jgi:hypothetical protein
MKILLKNNCLDSLHPAGKIFLEKIIFTDNQFNFEVRLAKLFFKTFFPTLTSPHQNKAPHNKTESAQFAARNKQDVNNNKLSN